MCRSHCPSASENIFPFVVDDSMRVETEEKEENEEEEEEEEENEERR